MIEYLWHSHLRTWAPELVAILVIVGCLLYYNANRAEPITEIQAPKNSFETSKERQALKIIPSAPWVPVLGSLPFLGWYPARKMTHWGREKGYGPLFRVRYGTKHVLILNDLETIRDGFLRNGNRTSGRWQTPVLEEITLGHGILFIDLDTKKGRKQKSFGHSAFRKITANAKIDQVIGAEALNACDAIRKQISNDNNQGDYVCGNYRRVPSRFDDVSLVLGSCENDDWKTMRPDSFVHKFTANVMCKLLFGRSFRSDETEYNYVLEETPVQARKSFASFMLVFLLPSVRYMPVIKGVIDEALHLRKATFKMIQEITNEHIKNFNSSKEDVDFIDCFLSEMLGKANPEKFGFTYDQLLTYVFDVYTAGVETTADTLVWGLLYLARDQRLQNEIRNEIMAIAAEKDYFPSSKVTSRMHLLQATVHELLRIRPITTLGIPHRATTTCEVNGFKIPKDSVVMANIWSVHHNPEVFPDPERFDPYRHMNQAGEFVPCKDVISFSFGPRRCLGKKIAETDMFFMLTTLIRNFSFRLPRIWDSAKNGCITVSPDMNGTEGQVLLPPEFDLEWKMSPVFVAES